MTKYNGHKNWNYRNVSLWINNDEGLYRLAQSCLRNCEGRKAAAEEMLYLLSADSGPAKTPDGTLYSVSSIRAAMGGM